MLTLIPKIILYSLHLKIQPRCPAAVSHDSLCARCHAHSPNCNAPKCNEALGAPAKVPCDISVATYGEKDSEAIANQFLLLASTSSFLVCEGR